MFDGCFVRMLFGVYCPGCGGTRAVISLLHGRILESLWYHPVVLYTVVAFGYHLILRRKPKVAWLFGALGIIVGNCLVKNILLLVFHIEMI